MLKIIADKWAKNQNKLREELTKTNIEFLRYKDLVHLTFKIIYNDDEHAVWPPNINVNRITEIDDGNYQGTLLFLLPFDIYQPMECEYLMTYVGYGSCSGCDTLQHILSLNNDWDAKYPNERQVNDLMVLCKDILANTICPYYNSPYNNHTEELREIKYEA